MRKNDAASSFKALYGTKPNAFGKCVSALGEASRLETETEATQEAKENAAKACKKERDD